jgi:hypothetical protein
MQGCDIGVDELTLRNFLQVVEADKCNGWKWLTVEELHQINDASRIKKEEKEAKGEQQDPPSGDELFLPLINLLKQEPNLNNFFDDKKGILIGPEAMPNLKDE